LIVDHATWRWIFWLNLPLGILAMLFAWRLVPELETTQDKQFDWLGFFLIGSALFCLMLAAEILSRPDAAWHVALTSLAVGIGLIALGTRHLRRTLSPMVDLDALQRSTFAVTVWGGSLFRMGVSAVPFLLPLMFQLAFGFDAFNAGLMLMAVFAGNLVMKPLTTPVLQRFGFRPVLVANGLINAGAIAACAGVTATMPLWSICAILFVGGMSRSMQFTALNTIAFADIPAKGMASANTLFSTAFQLAMGLGIALGAVAWRIGESVAGADDPAATFRIAFLLVAGVAALATIDSIRLDAEAGRHVSARKAG
jgi:MFS family permease